MPWAISDDLDGFKKGMTAEQKSVWVRVANAALDRCNKAGGKDCEASAIMQANSVVDRQMSFDGWFAEFEKKFNVVQTFNLNGIEIFSVGTWNGDKYSGKDLDAMVNAFDQVGFEPPLKLGHNTEQEKDGQPAIGWIGNIYRQGSKLFADFKELPLKVYEALKRGNYKTVSSEIYWNYKRKGSTFSRVLRAVALLGADIPAVTDLDSISNLYKDHNDSEFKIYNLLTHKKEVEEMEAVELLKEKVKNLESENSTLKTDTKELGAAKKELSEKTASLETEKKELSDKNKQLSDKEKEAKTQLAEQEAKAKASHIETYISNKKKEGKVLPKFEKELTVLMSKADDKEIVHSYHDKDEKKIELSQFQLIEKIVDSFPKMIEFREMGGDGDAGVSDDYSNQEEAGIEVDKRTKSLMEKEKIKDYSEAMNKVLGKDLELKKAYMGGE